jgi:bacteriocin-like protein
MSEQEQTEQNKDSTNISPHPDAENKKKESPELSEEELKKVTGGVGSTPVSSGYGPSP